MLKRLFCFFLLLVVFICSACTMESIISETGETYCRYFENQELFSDAVQELEKIGNDAFISKTEYYSVDGVNDIEDFYIQNMSESTCMEYENSAVEKLFEICGVKLVDVIYRGDMVICSFDMCIPGKNYDYGIYFVSRDSAIYLGDPTIPLAESGKGFTYEQSASYGTKFTYYTEKLSDNYYYYEIM